MIESEKKRHLFCINCGARLIDNANFCGICGCPVKLDLLPYDKESDKQVGKEEQSEETNHKKPNLEVNEPFSLRIAEKRYTIRKSYIIYDENENVLYTAKSEGLPKMPEIVVYEKERRIGLVEKELFANPVWGDSEYTLYWSGKRYASLERKKTIKRVYKIPEYDWTLELGIMTSKLYDNHNSLLMTIDRVISTTQDRYYVKYYDIKNEPAAVLFTLVDAMNIDLK